MVSGSGGGPWGSGHLLLPEHRPEDVDIHAHELAVAQLAAAADVAERLDATYARLERRLERIAASMAGLDAGAISVSPGQLRLVAGE